MNLKFGADPEFAIIYKDGDKAFAVPPAYFIETLGIKPVEIDPKMKHPVMLQENNFKVIMDGVAFELTLPPVTEAKSMYQNVQDALNAINDFAHKHGFELYAKPTSFYDFHKFFKEGSPLLQQCGIFGCDPDRDAIQSDYYGHEFDVENHPYRYYGGHFHFSDLEKFIYAHPYPMIHCLALTVGNYVIANSSEPELEKLRAFHYGQPGRFRVQNYPNGECGVEYRSPSNLWTTSFETIQGVFEYAKKAYELVKNPQKGIDLINNLMPSTIEAISDANKELALANLNAIN